MIHQTSCKLKRIRARLALLSIEMMVVLTMFIISLIAFILITRYVFILKDEQFDIIVFDFLKTHISERNTGIMLFFTFFGAHLFLIPANIVLIIFFLFIRKNKWYSIKIPALALSSLGLMILLKNLFGRHRPDLPLLKEATGLSYPSGHALMSVTFYGLLIYIVWQTVKNRYLKWALTILLIGMIFIIGVSRIYLRVHFPSDVLAGFATGFLWLVISIWILNRLKNKSLLMQENK